MYIPAVFANSTCTHGRSNGRLAEMNAKDMQGYGTKEKEKTEREMRCQIETVPSRNDVQLRVSASGLGSERPGASSVPRRGLHIDNLYPFAVSKPCFGRFECATPAPAR